MRGTTRDMSDRHEKDLVLWLGGRRTAGSGNQPNNPMDGRHNRYEQSIAFAWDGKSTLGKSISITEDMWFKAEEQCLAERPMLALRWYRNERLTSYQDLAAISMDDFRELLDLAADGTKYRAMVDDGTIKETS